MKREDLFVADTLRVHVTVGNKAAGGTIGALTNLVGATLTAAIGTPDQTRVAGVVLPIDLANGVVDVAFPAVGNIPLSYVVAQLKVVRSGEAQVAWSQVFSLRPSVV